MAEDMAEGTASDTASRMAAVSHRLVEGRECGACNVCCVSLTINDPALRKLQGYRCPNATPENLCRIYESRPDTCRGFFCGWRLLKWVRPNLRPDVSGVLIRLHGESSEAGGTTLGIVVSLLTHASLKADGLAETVAAAVRARIPVYLHVPGPPGYTAASGRINEILEDAVATANKPRVLELLRGARAEGLRGKKRPIGAADMGTTYPTLTIPAAPSAE